MHGPLAVDLGLAGAPGTRVVSCEAVFIIITMTPDDEGCCLLICCLASIPCLLQSLATGRTLCAGVGPGVVEAWAAGGTWAQVTADSNLDDGDIMRLLNRTSDLLRQARASLRNPAQPHL